MSAVPTTIDDGPTPPRTKNLLGRLKRINRLFLYTVVIPTALAIIYFGLLASDIYVSESRFMVRSPQKPIQAGMLGSLLQSTGIARTLDDQYSVHDYILSRDALKELKDPEHVGDRRPIAADH